MDGRDLAQLFNAQAANTAAVRAMMIVLLAGVDVTEENVMAQAEPFLPLDPVGKAHMRKEVLEAVRSSLSEARKLSKHAARN